MRFIDLKLYNFRQFYGETPKIRLSHGDKNITVFHGMNGAGKTALLNAFTWILYGVFSKGFQKENELISKRAIAEADVGETVECYGELNFENAGTNYRIKKVVDAVVADVSSRTKERLKETTLQAQKPDGQWNTVRNIDSVIGKILPTDLHSYFFFDGERVEKIVAPSAEEKARLANAVKILLGVEPLERAIKHLNSGRKHFEKEMGRLGSDETKEAIAEKIKVDKKHESLDAKINARVKKVDNQRDIVSKLNERIAKHASVEPLTKARDDHKDRIERSRKAVNELTDRLKSVISDRAFLLHTDELKSKVSTFLSELKIKGDLPSGIKAQFVEKLIRKGTCICGRSLDPKESVEAKEAHKTVSRWLEIKGLQQIEDRALNLSANINTWGSRNKDTLEVINDINGQIKEFHNEIARSSEELEAISKKLEGSPLEEISSLESKRKSEDDLLREYIEELGSSRNMLELLAEKQVEISSKIIKLTTKDEKQKLAKERYENVDQVIKATKEVLKLMNEKWRHSLEEKIRGNFSQISVKDYTPRLNKDYSINLYDKASDREVAAGQGESLVLSFSFISSIIEEIRKLTSAHGGIYGTGNSEFPLIMDSPFGALDDINRSRVAAKISMLADQVITFVSKTQWREEVENAMQPKTNYSYVLTYHSPREDTITQDIKLGTKTYDLIKPSINDFEHTEIKEVING
jgi:DNA sulfur modification protein DndD